MKRTIVVAVAATLAAVLFAGCAAGGTLKPYESTPPQVGEKDPYATDFGGSMAEFTAEDLNGNTVTQDILADYDLTVVEIWATWCPSCVAAMPEVGSFYSQLPENINYISICSDGSTKTDKAKTIVEADGAGYTVLKDGESINAAVTNHVMGFPSFIFVDSRGKAVGKIQLGVPGGYGNIAQALLDMANARLELLEKNAE